jgi:hypothetical protein
MMTPLLKAAFNAASQRIPSEQDKLAELLVGEIHPIIWDELLVGLADPEYVQELEREAAKVYYQGEMTKRLKEAQVACQERTVSDQDVLAAFLFGEINDLVWDELFARSESHALFRKMTEEIEEERQRGRVRKRSEGPHGELLHR